MFRIYGIKLGKRILNFYWRNLGSRLSCVKDRKQNLS